MKKNNKHMLDVKKYTLTYSLQLLSSLAANNSSVSKMDVFLYIFLGPGVWKVRCTVQFFVYFHVSMLYEEKEAATKKRE